DTWLPIAFVRVHEPTPHFVAGDRSVFGSPHEPSRVVVEIRLPVGNLHRRRKVLVAQADVECQALGYPEIILRVGAVLPLPLARNAQQQRPADVTRVTQDEAGNCEPRIRIDDAPGGDAGAI